MVRKCSFLRNFVGQRWSVVDRGSERFALVPAPSDQIGPMHDLYPSWISPPACRPLALVGEVVARAEDIRDLVVAFGHDRLLKSHEVGL